MLGRGADTQVTYRVGAGMWKSEELLPPLLPGGNAGIAAAYSARKLGIPVTIVLPENTSMQVVRRLEGEGAEVQLTGKVRSGKQGQRAGGGVLSSPPPHPTPPHPTALPLLARTSVLVFSLLSGGWREERTGGTGWDLWTCCPTLRRPLSEGWRVSAILTDTWY